MDYTATSTTSPMFEAPDFLPFTLLQEIETESGPWLEWFHLW